MTIKKEYYPQMHTAEHILNQTMVRMFGTERSFNNHIERKKSKCDYHFTRNLSDNEISELESNVNKIIHNNLEVKEEFLNRKEAQIILKTEKLGEYEGDQIRIIKIGDYDSCPCIGQHVESTGEIGQFRITTTSFENGVLRIRFKLSEK